MLLLVWLLPPSYRTRNYFLAIDEVEWDYVGGSPTNNCTGEPWGYPETKYVEHKEGARIGSTYTKAVFREYTDAKFTTPKPRPEAHEHLGLLGPMLRAEVRPFFRPP